VQEEDAHFVSWQHQDVSGDDYNLGCAIEQLGKRSNEDPLLI